MKYRAFISYSHADEAAAGRLHRALEGFTLPRALVGGAGKHGAVQKKLAPIFRDREELTAAGSLAQEIRAALEGSLFLVVVCSPNSAKSHWVNEEIKLFKRLHGGERVLALIVAGEPGAAAKGRPEAECFPPALRFALDGAGEVSTIEAEPIAADSRKEGDGWRDAFLKLVAGLAGVGLDDIVRREAQRRYRAMTYIASAAVALSAVMGLVTNYALDQRTAAVKARGQAEDLVSFMLTDLRKKLDAVGRLDVLQDVGKEALAYYKKQSAKSLDPDALGRRARSLLLVGEVDNARGDLDAALAAYKEAAQTTAEQLRRDPKNPRRMFDHAQSTYWVGYVAWQRGDRQTAERQMRDYLRLAEAMVAAEPANADYQAEVGYANSNLGTLMIDLRRWNEALGFFQKSRARNEMLVKKSPDDTSVKMDLAQDLSWIARAEEAVGRFIKAREALAQELLIYDEVLSQSPNQRASGAMVSAQNNMGRIYLAEGKVLAAISMLKTATRGADLLLKLDSTNKFWVRIAVGANIELARAAHYSPNGADQTKRALARAEELAANLNEKDRTVAEWAVLSAGIATLKAEMANSSRNSVAAAAAAEHAIALLRSLGGEHGHPDATIRAAEARALLAMGDAQVTLGLGQNPYWESALTRITANIEDPTVPDRALAAVLNCRLRHFTEARRLYDSLVKLGYNHPVMGEIKADLGAARTDLRARN